MKLTQLLLSCAIAAAGVPSASAYTVGQTSTISNVTFFLQTTDPFYSPCNDIAVDATGDFVNSSLFTLYGVLNCPAVFGGYTITGSGYFAVDGSINLNFFLGTGATLSCPRVFGSSGLCTFYNSNGNSFATAVISLR